MLSIIGRLTVATFGVCVSGTSVLAAIQCPAMFGGHSLRASDGGSLYSGIVSKNIELAPDSSQLFRGSWVNTWRITQGQSVILVYRYNGTQQFFTQALPQEVKICRQDPSSFVWR